MLRIAAATALRELAHALAGLSCSLACGGTVGRAENRALVHYLGLKLRPVDQIDPARFDIIGMVDTQPGQGNNALPPGTVPDVVVDHHSIRHETQRAPFSDVRSRYGATSTILFEYLQAALVTPSTPLATALLYGIRSDTQDLGREATQADKDAYGVLYPLANKRMLGTIQRGEVPTEYFRMLAVALDNAVLCGRCIYSGLGVVENADMIAEVADLLLRHEAVDWSLCWGCHEDRCLLSIRTMASEGRADVAIRSIVSRKGTGGGHRTMAGGQISVGAVVNRVRLDQLIVRRFLNATGNDKATPSRLC